MTPKECDKCFAEKYTVDEQNHLAINRVNNKVGRTRVYCILWFKPLINKHIGVRAKKFWGRRTLVCPTSCIAANVVGGSRGILPRENFEM